MNLLSNRTAILTRLADRAVEFASKFEGPVFRFVRPKFSKTEDLFAGKGPLHVGGRWMLKGNKSAVYTSLLPETALAEALAANRYYGFPDESSAPLVFVTAQARLEHVIDLRDGAVRQRLRLAQRTMISTDWRLENANEREAVTQAWGWAFHEAGVEGIVCPSATTRSGSNLIAFPENFQSNASLQVIAEVEWPR